MVTLGKKGIFFTFVAVLLLATLALSFSVFARYDLSRKALVTETRVSTMNSFMKDIDKDISRGVFISSHRSILSMVEHISSEGEFLADAEETFAEVFINGTINGNPQALMEETTFTDWIEKMKALGSEINLELDFGITSVLINQSDPWNVDINLDVGLYAADISEIAEWNVTKSLLVKLPVEGFEDPVYAVKTGGKLLNKINKTPYTDFVAGNDTTNLQAHTENSYYLAWSTAPSFLMRLEGNFSASPYGIESLIDLQKLIDQGETVQSRSAVDHIYWSNKPVTSYSIDNMPGWFMMDNENNPSEGINHLELYEVDGLT
ncbi:hypothetical protein JW707_00865 [Candidatus Woesearchaeota archaeon]|nr:hypothetical protein [Candidatus Woesearchaeota archaeon]